VLKALGVSAAFALAGAVLFFFATVPAKAQTAVLLTGSVRDQSGEAPAARIVARDAAGRIVGTTETSRDGTFSALLDGAAADVEVRCLHCAPFHAKTTGGPLVLIVTRFRALDGGTPDAADFAALPYRDPAQAVALTPWVVALQAPGGRVAALSDRGLGNGEGLVLDDGVPAYDPATGDPGLYAFPARSAGAVDVTPAAQAFTYGSYAGGGIFAFDPFAQGAGGDAALDLGQDYAFAARARAGQVDAALAESRDDDGIARQRFDAALSSQLGGGTLRAVVGVAAQQSADLSLGDDRSRALASLTYARTSQRAVTDVAIDALETHALYSVAPLGPDYGTSAGALEARLDVARPGWVEYDYGTLVRRASAGFGDDEYDGYLSGPPNAAYWSQTAYVAAKHDGPLGFDAGIGLENASLRAAGESTSTETVALPSLSANASLGGGFALRAGVSSALREPLPYELYDETQGDYGLARSALQEGSLDYDDGRRFRFGASLFRENVTGFAAHALGGLGLSLAWQIAPRLSLRAWTLHDDLAPYTPALALSAYPPGASIARATAWLSYEAPGGLRFDAIDRGSSGGSTRETDLDADVVVPLRAGFAFTAGSERERGKRRAYVGLRVARD
jgi:hypothetical protein